MSKKKKYLLNVAYQIVTPKSSETGDFAETGMYDTGLEFNSLKEMAQYIVDEGGAEPSVSSGAHYGMFFSTVDPLRDYNSDEETYYTFHPQDLTLAELKRLVEMFWKALERYGD